MENDKCAKFALFICEFLSHNFYCQGWFSPVGKQLVAVVLLGSELDLVGGKIKNYFPFASL